MLIVNQFSFEEIISFGFDISYTQYTRAKISNNNSKVTLNPYKRTMPLSKSELSKEKISYIVKTYIKFSSNSFKMFSKTLEFINFSIDNFNENTIYYLNKSKKKFTIFINKIS